MKEGWNDDYSAIATAGILNGRQNSPDILQKHFCQTYGNTHCLNNSSRQLELSDYRNSVIRTLP
ncbi:hypothetical protein CSA37_12120 [Candidatus Fermentibacteria bacterium]|nr:MAG: hypothetical protein CSA37_12120 [Candidatus Fermentibacteria bacterium]